MTKFKTTIILLLICLLLTGCVERLITVTSRPSGAIVWLNDQEVGATPVTVPFTYYGQYDVVIRKEGFDTVKTSRKTPVPIYQWPVLDFFSECMLPWEFTDRHQWDFQMSPRTTTTTADDAALIQRARALRHEASTQP